jgi:hypothetical protein
MLNLLRQFGDDPTVLGIAGLVVLDFVFGVSAAFKTDTFRLSYFADFMRSDVLGKLVPYCGLWLVLHVTGDINIGGFDAIEETIAVAIGIALGGSILNSARDLGFLPTSTPDELAGSDPSAPAPPPSP